MLLKNTVTFNPLIDNLISNIDVKYSVKHLYITIAICLLCTGLSAQKGWEVGGWIGASWYKGDLNTTIDLSQIGPAAGLVFKRNFNDRISLTSQFNYAYLKGDDAEASNTFQQQRNLNFVSNVFEWTPAFEFNFFPYNHGSAEEYFTPYLYAGFTLARFNPKSTHGDELTELQPLNTEGQRGSDRYRLTTGGLAYGFGLKYDVSNVWSINVAANGRRLFTDYLDDVSTVYPSASTLDGDAVFYSNPSEVDGFGAVGTQRGDSNTVDQYFTLTIGIFRYFGRLECPTISRIK